MRHHFATGMATPDSKRFLRGHLKTRHMVLLVELGRHGSIAQAAEAAGLTQPAASKLLGELEHALGVTLFQRLPRGVEPTVHGEIMIRRAGAALAEMDAAHQEVTQGLAGIVGRVAIGSVLTPSIGLVPEAIKLLKSRNAGIKIALTVDTSIRMVELLRGGELDIVIGRIVDARLADELHFEPLADEPHRLVVRAGHPWAKRQDLSLAELAGQRWIVPPPGIVRDRLLALFVSAGLNVPVDTIETSAMPAVVPLLEHSDAVVALPAELVQEHIDAGRLALLAFDFGLRADVYGLVTRKRHLLSPAAEAMLAALRETARR